MCHFSALFLSLSLSVPRWADGTVTSDAVAQQTTVWLLQAAKIKGTISRKAGRPIVANIFGNVKFQALYLLKGVQIYEGNVSEGLHWFTIAGIDHEDEDGDLEEGNDLGHFCVKSEHFDDYKGFLASCRKARLDQNLELTLDETKDAEQTEIQRLSAAAAAEAAESTIEFHGSGDAFASDCSDKENAQETMFTPKGKNRRKSFFQNSTATSILLLDLLRRSVPPWGPWGMLYVVPCISHADWRACNPMVRPNLGLQVLWVSRRR